MFRRIRYMIEKNFELKRNFDNKKDIRKEEINQYIKQGAILIDVRSPQEYREGHLDGAISIPDYQIRRTITRKITNKEQIIVVYCSTGHRSQEAQRILENISIFDFKLDDEDMNILNNMNINKRTSHDPLTYDF